MVEGHGRSQGGVEGQVRLVTAHAVGEEVSWALQTGTMATTTMKNAHVQRVMQ